MQGRVLVVVASVNVSAIFEEQLDTVILAIACCKVEGSPAFLILSILVLARLQQFPQCICLTCTSASAF